MTDKRYKCKLKSRARLEKEIPRDKWGWWIDICPGKTLLLRQATAEDLARCSIEGNPRDYMCEIPEYGSLVSKAAIEYVQAPIELIE